MQNRNVPKPSPLPPARVGAGIELDVSPCALGGFLTAWGCLREGHPGQILAVDYECL